MVVLAFWNVEFSFKNPFYRRFDKEVKSIGDHIRKRRIELGLFQKDVALKLKVGEDAVTYWENNRAKPMVHHMPLIISFLGYNPLIIEKETLGGKVKFYRYLNGLSHKKFGKLLRVDASTVASWEKNESLPHPSTMKRIEKYLMTIS